MSANKADIIHQLRKDILLMQGFKPVVSEADLNSPLSLIRHAFPNSNFPLSGIHEFVCDRIEDCAASGGFIAGIVSSIMKKGGACIWIGQSREIFPPALVQFGIAPETVIFIELQRRKEMLWAMEEALKCDALAAVIGEIKEVTFTESRRFQLAVENSGVTGFLLRHQPKNLTTATVTCWKITHLQTDQQSSLPGLGFPRWNVELLKVRNGKPGSWQLEWRSGKFRHIMKTASIISKQRKTG
jgi:protein ImuA